jgi:hypothetical protein
MPVLPNEYYSPQKFSEEDTRPAMQPPSSEALIQSKLHKVSTSFLTGNIMHLHYKDKLVHAVNCKNKRSVQNKP